MIIYTQTVVVVRRMKGKNTRRKCFISIDLLEYIGYIVYNLNEIAGGENWEEIENVKKKPIYNASADAGIGSTYRVYRKIK
jgi:hypothetical protein